jgi:amidase
MAGLNLVEASIDDLQQALTSGLTTSVELVSLYLRRISTYDCRGPLLNAIPVLNPAVFDEAAASDQRRRQGQPRPLEGIPFTVKDSYKVKGLTVASGSSAFQSLIANEDAFTVRCLREAGAVLIGLTNMPPMAAGGVQRGVYGRAESPYNLEYLTAAFASGSSNGSATATAASMAAFGMGVSTDPSTLKPKIGPLGQLCSKCNVYRLTKMYVCRKRPSLRVDHPPRTTAWLHTPHLEVLSRFEEIGRST